MTAVKAAPGSSQPNSAGTMRRCPLLEIGRNSVSPWTIPSTMAWKAFMRRPRVLRSPRRRARRDRAEVRLETVQVEGAERVEAGVLGAVEVGRAGRQQAGSRAVIGDQT